MRFWPEYIILAFVLACAAACSSQVDSPMAPTPREICLAGSTSPVVGSRASQDLPADYNLWVAAIYHSQDNNEHTYYFKTEKKFTCCTSDNLWKGADEDLYYPLSGSMDLLAYALLNDAHKPVASYSPGVLSASNCSFASMTLDFGSDLDGSDPVIFSDIQSTSCGSAVTIPVLQFRHAMAKVVFSARTADQATADHFTIHQFTVKDVKTSGVLQVTAKHTTTINDVSSGSTYNWLSLSAAQDVVLVDEGASIRPLLTSDTDNPGYGIGHPMYLPPQDNPPAEVTVELIYSYLDSTSSSIGPECTLITLPAANWLSGYQYNYIINCSLNEISVECSNAGAIVDTNPIDVNFDEKYKGDNPI